jgi:hypothetical protein
VARLALGRARAGQFDEDRQIRWPVRNAPRWRPCQPWELSSLVVEFP